MSEQLTLQAQPRDRAGKGASRELRRQGRVPAVIYGQGQTPVPIHLEEKALVKALSTGHFMTTVVALEGSAPGGAPIRTLPKDVAFHPVTDRPMHADFLRIDEHSRVTVQVPIVFEGAEEGSHVTAAMHEVALSCDAANIPAEIRVDVSALAVGQAIRLADVLPVGAEYAGDAVELVIVTNSVSAGQADTDDLLDDVPPADAVPATEVPGGESVEQTGDNTGDEPAQG